MRKEEKTIPGQIDALETTTNDLVRLLQLFTLDQHRAIRWFAVHDPQFRRRGTMNNFGQDSGGLSNEIFGVQLHLYE